MLPRCRGSDIQEADRRFDGLGDEPADIRQLEIFKDALDQINLGAMPPKDEPQPSGALRIAVAAKMQAILEAASKKLADRSGTTVLRRLNRFEYDRSDRQLLSLNSSSLTTVRSGPQRPLEPDIRAAGSIRDQLRKHRTVATCNACHQKIDPLGFALESFDEIGRYRDYYHQSKTLVRGWPTPRVVSQVSRTNSKPRKLREANRRMKWVSDR